MAPLATEKAGYFFRREAVNAIISTEWAGPDWSRNEMKPPQHMILPNYLLSKANDNILITGSSGEGKSLLTRHILTNLAISYPDRQVLIFSFKPHDIYARMGYPIVREGLYPPSVFGDPDSFVAAWDVAFPFTMRGIQASLVPAVLRKAVGESASWQGLQRTLQDHLRLERDGNLRSVLRYIQTKAEILAGKGLQSFMPRYAAAGAVLDFSGMPRPAATFYAEFILRDIWRQLQERRRGNVIICVEEAHWLLGTRRETDQYSSILSMMAREIRVFGSLVLVTQNLTDVPEDERNQYGTQFAFKSRHEHDLRAVRSVSPDLQYALSSLRMHEFVDVQEYGIHHGVSIWQLWRPYFVDYYETVMEMTPLSSPPLAEVTPMGGLAKVPEGGWQGAGGGLHARLVSEVRSFLVSKGHRVDPEPLQGPGLSAPDLSHVAAPDGTQYRDEIEIEASHPDQVQKNLEKAGGTPVVFWTPDRNTAMRVQRALGKRSGFEIMVHDENQRFRPLSEFLLADSELQELWGAIEALIGQGDTRTLSDGCVGIESRVLAARMPPSISPRYLRALLNQAAASGSGERGLIIEKVESRHPREGGLVHVRGGAHQTAHPSREGPP